MPRSLGPQGLGLNINKNDTMNWAKTINVLEVSLLYVLYESLGSVDILQQ